MNQQEIDIHIPPKSNSAFNTSDAFKETKKETPKKKKSDLAESIYVEEFSRFEIIEILEVKKIYFNKKHNTKNLKNLLKRVLKMNHPIHDF